MTEAVTVGGLMGAQKPTLDIISLIIKHSDDVTSLLLCRRGRHTLHAESVSSRYIMQCDNSNVMKATLVMGSAGKALQTARGTMEGAD